MDGKLPESELLAGVVFHSEEMTLESAFKLICQRVREEEINADYEIQIRTRFIRGRPNEDTHKS